MAHWIMGDGSQRDTGLMLCTDSVTIQDTVRLINVLKIRYDLNSTLRIKNPGQYRIYIRQESMHKLVSIVNATHSYVWFNAV